MNIILAGLVGAITWNLVTWYLGLPSSSSHALIGGVMGSAIMADGWSVVQWAGLWQKVLKPSLIAPFAGLAVAFVLMTVIVWVIKRRSPAKVNRVFRRGQLVSGGFVALTHGTNDAQKTMGIIALALVSSGHLNADFTRPPTWVIVVRGALDVRGHVRRRLADHPHSRDSHREDRPAAGLRGADGLRRRSCGRRRTSGIPVSTTQVISGSVMGAGATRGLHAVRWGVAGNIVVAWIFTIPMAGLVGAGMELVTRLPGGDLIVFGLAVADLLDGIHGAPLGDPASAAARGTRERSDLGGTGREAAGRVLAACVGVRNVGYCECSCGVGLGRVVDVDREGGTVMFRSRFCRCGSRRCVGWQRCRLAPERMRP